VRGAVLASKGVDAAAGGPSLLLEASYPQLCRQVPGKHLRPCLAQLSELAFELVASYELMAQFHAANQRALRGSRGGSGGSGGGGGGSSSGGDADAPAGGEDDQMAAVQSATRGLLQAVDDALRGARGEVAEAAGARVRELLAAPEIARAEGVAQVARGSRE
jgi:hypothetical protein